MNYMNGPSIIHPDELEYYSITHTNTPVSDSTLNDLRCSDYISSEVMEVSDDSDEWNKLLKEVGCFERECNDAYVLAYQNEMVQNYSNVYPREFLCEPKSPKKNVEDFAGKDVVYEKKIYEVKHKIGNGKMDYIKDIYIKNMLMNAWKALTISNNWDFVGQDIESFIDPDNEKINEISKKMEELGYIHQSRASFCTAMRYMQFLVRNGEEKFEQLFSWMI